MTKSTIICIVNTLSRYLRNHGLHRMITWASAFGFSIVKLNFKLSIKHHSLVTVLMRIQLFFFTYIFLHSPVVHKKLGLCLNGFTTHKQTPHMHKNTDSHTVSLCLSWYLSCISHYCCGREPIMVYVCVSLCVFLCV